ncbi:MAG TPA: hypothetical protein VFG83_01585 [Kofleriaceae bacterium]|nr:hypothetical protein [Kofleriaceae bacterium]
MIRMPWLSALALGLLAFAACSRDEIEVPKNAGPASAVARAWLEAGLEVADFAPAPDAKIDGDCVSGNVSEIAVLVCQLPKPTPGKQSTTEIAEHAEEQGLKMIGDAPSGASLAHHGRLLVIADRHSLDPDGKVVNQITEIFRKTGSDGE